MLSRNGHLVEIYKFLGKDVCAGQGDIAITWKWLCKEPDEHLFFATNSEAKLPRGTRQSPNSIRTEHFMFQ